MGFFILNVSYEEKRGRVCWWWFCFGFGLGFFGVDFVGFF